MLQPHLLSHVLYIRSPEEFGWALCSGINKEKVKLLTQLGSYLEAPLPGSFRVWADFSFGGCGTKVACWQPGAPPWSPGSLLPLLQYLPLPTSKGQATSSQSVESFWLLFLPQAREHSLLLRSHGTVSDPPWWSPYLSEILLNHTHHSSCTIRCASVILHILPTTITFGYFQFTDE